MKKGTIITFIIILGILVLLFHVIFKKFSDNRSFYDNLVASGTNSAAPAVTPTVTPDIHEKPAKSVINSAPGAKK